MKCYIVDTLSGIFALDDSSNIINFLDFNENEQKILEFYKSIENGEIEEDLNELLSELKQSGYNEFIFDNAKLKLLISKELDLESTLETSSLEFKNFRLELKTQLDNIGINKSKEEIAARHKKISEELIKMQVSQAGEQGDVAVIQIIETLDILKKTISLFSVRLREWYGLHFPELTDQVIEDNLVLARLVSILGHRDNYTKDNIAKEFDLNDDRVQFLVEQASGSMGAEINLNTVKGYAEQIISLDSYRQELEDKLEGLMETTAPNLKAIIGSLVGAKLITKAGSLKKLAYMPASRIQLLGAETALYRFLKTGKGIPKHGLIFQWNQIRGSKPWIRGKISRVVSGKIGLAAKIDHFQGEFMGKEISDDLSRKIKEIELRHPKPPKKVEQRRVSKPHPKKKKKSGKGGRKK
jgi:nucleolar protein 56